MMIAELTVLGPGSTWPMPRIEAYSRSSSHRRSSTMTWRAQGATPPKVVIQEYVRLAERYGSERSAGFVNGVLDAHARRIGALA